jgi:hypothetical protein
VLAEMKEICAKQSMDDGCIPLGISVANSSSYMTGCNYLIECEEDCSQKSDTPPDTEGSDPDPNPTGPYDPGGEAPL